MYDVSVIGAGPAGSYTAYLLAKKGYSVVVLEEDPMPGINVLCSGIIGKEAFDRFNLPENSTLNSLQSLRFISPSGITLRYDAKRILAYIIDRKIFDFNIAQWAEKEEVSYLCNSHVEAIEVEKNRVKVIYSNEEKREHLYARISVVASGFGSSLLNSFDGFNSIDFLQAAQVEAPMRDIKEVEIYLGQDIAPQSFAWAIPTHNNMVRIGLTTKERARYYMTKLLETPLIKERLDSSDISINYSLIPLAGIKRSFRERMILVGEAAGQVKTTTGGGIYYGLLCSEIASDVIDKKFQKGGVGHEAAFSEYDKRWKEILRPEMKMGCLLRKLYNSFSDRHINFLIDIANRDGIMPIVMKKANFDWHANLISSLLKFITPLSTET
ncbi:MAG: geranylgeranyl reductase family protein [Nitrospirota bacterium]